MTHPLPETMRYTHLKYILLKCDSPQERTPHCDSSMHNTTTILQISKGTYIQFSNRDSGKSSNSYSNYQMVWDIMQIQVDSRAGDF